MDTTINTIEAIVPKEHRDLVLRFFLVFSRFEYALKRAGFINGSSDSVQPSWDGFSSRYRSTFDPSLTPELRAAYDYFVANPPRKQIFDGGALGWSEPQIRTTEPPFTWLLLMLRSVRNNLFHGGKYPIAPIQDPARNPALLQHSLIVLDACLPMNADVARHFSTDEH